LVEDQKIILGGSSGINIAGAIKLAKKMGPGHNIVTILCDDGRRYASKIFNKKFLLSKNLPIPQWL
jgi:cysteine synthase A